VREKREGEKFFFFAAGNKRKQRRKASLPFV
jgi:hypothetical protein